MRTFLFLVIATLAMADATAAEDRWYVEKKVDPMDDSRKCHVGNLGGYDSASVMLTWSLGTFWISAGAGAYPRSHVDIRVDGNAAVSVRQGSVLRGDEASELLKQLQVGEVVKTRYYSWPKNIERVGVSQVANLPALIAECVEYIAAE